MHWTPWALGTVGILQYIVIAVLRPDDYVSVDAAYIVLFLCIIGGLLLCYTSCGSYGGGCGCCGDECHCGDCASCQPARHEEHHGHSGHGHEGHQH